MTLKAFSIFVCLVVPTRCLKAFVMRYNRKGMDLSRVSDSWVPPAFQRREDERNWLRHFRSMFRLAREWMTEGP